jgi:hypothetical protein
MLDKAYRFGWIGVLSVVLVGGCSPKPTNPVHGAADDETAVREKFAALQEAVGKEDAEKIWSLMDDQSRADAERAAQAVRAAHDKATAEEKANQEKDLGLTAAEVAVLTGPGVLKTKRFQRKYGELPESKVEKLTVQGDNATVYYVEPDNDKEKLHFVRQEGQWKAWLAVPKLPGK